MIGTWACSSQAQDCCSEEGESNQASDPVYCLWVWLQFLGGDQYCKALVHCHSPFAHASLNQEDWGERPKLHFTNMLLLWSFLLQFIFSIAVAQCGILYIMVHCSIRVKTLTPNNACCFQSPQSGSQMLTLTVSVLWLMSWSLQHKHTLDNALNLACTEADTKQRQSITARCLKYVGEISGYSAPIYMSVVEKNPYYWS